MAGVGDHQAFGAVTAHCVEGIGQQQIAVSTSYGQNGH